MKIASYSNHEQARLASLASYDLMDTEQDHEYDELTQLAAEICETPIALITLIGETRQWFKSRYGTDVSETHRSIAFCEYTISQTEEILIVPDARQDERFHNNPMVTGEANIVFYAGVPLVNTQGYALGSICVLSHERKELTGLQIRALRVLGKQVVHQMELRRKLREIQDSNEALSESYQFIEKFAERAAHDIKSPLSNIIITSQTLKMLLSKSENPRTLKLLDILVASGKNLTSYINELLGYSKSPSDLQVHHEEFELSCVLEKTINLIDIPRNCKIRLPEQSVRLSSSRIALEQIFLNLLTNAVRYNDKPEPKINIVFNEDDHIYHFHINDNGKGISTENQAKIFDHGFVTDEPDRYNRKGNGIGMNIVKSLVDKLGGSIRISSEVGVGTTFSVSVPKKRQCK